MCQRCVHRSPLHGLVEQVLAGRSSASSGRNARAKLASAEIAGDCGEARSASRRVDSIVATGPWQASTVASNVKAAAARSPNPSATTRFGSHPDDVGGDGPEWIDAHDALDEISRSASPPTAFRRHSAAFHPRHRALAILPGACHIGPASPADTRSGRPRLGPAVFSVQVAGIVA
jgi:hypothetical protein